jgi:hypothetical protein
MLIPNEFKKHADACVIHMINCGKCVYGNSKDIVFQGTNGNFYIMRDKNAKLFTGLFGKLKMLEEINEN